MVTDVVDELELNHEETFAASLAMGLLDGDYDKIRAFLGAFYLNSGFSMTWSKTSNMPYSSWISTCCEQQSSLEQDHALVWRVRLQHTADELVQVGKQFDRSKGTGVSSPHHRELIRIGLETQFREWQSRMPTNLAITRNYSFPLYTCCVGC
jgi:hypothetical protein